MLLTPSDINTLFAAFSQDVNYKPKAKIRNLYELGCSIVGSGSLAAVILGLGAASASAQLTIQSTGTVSGTIQLPSFNPNFNNRVTRVDTDSTGTYYRNLGSPNNPNLVPVYKSNYVQVQTRKDGSLHYFVDFKGIPVVSFDGVLNSPALSGGDLQPYSYQGKLPGTKFQAVVQDEFQITKGFYTGVVTDPKTGQQYQGTFQLTAEGPRYSARSGGDTPTVFDFKSDLPGKPTVTSLQMTNAPLTRVTITVPANATPVTTPSTGGTTTPSTGVTTPPPTSTPVSTAPSAPTPGTSGNPLLPPPAPTPTPSTGGSTTPSTPTPSTGGSTTPSAPSTVGITTPSAPTSSTSGSTTPSASSTGVNTTPSTPTVSSSGNPFPPTSAPSTNVNTAPTTSTSPTSPSASPSTSPNIEFSSGYSLATNQLISNPETLTSVLCSEKSAQCQAQVSTPKRVVGQRAVGPRSRVLVR